MFPILHLGSLSIQAPGLLLLLGLWIGLSISEKMVSKYRSIAQDTINLIYVFIFFSVIGGRLSYILRYPDVFSKDIMSIFTINPGLFNLMDGIVIGLLSAAIFGNRKKLPFWDTLDNLSPFLAVIAVSFHLSNLASGAGYGSPTNLPWSIELWGMYRHPVQAYEALAAFAVMGIVTNPFNLFSPLWPGKRFLLFTAITATSRLFLEGFHGDSQVLPGGYRIIQVFTWAILLVCLLIYRKLDSNSLRITIMKNSEEASG